MDKFTAQILQWGSVHSRKDLPWQQRRSPYRVWVSEIMLQQTQVATVIKFFDRFTQRFPDILSLHRASREEILSAWYGLGYYRRVLHMHETAHVIVSKYSGEFPRTLSELCSLPGIGRSTAGSILAAAWDEPAPILDANVRRVLSRFHGVNGPDPTKVPERKMWELAALHTPKENGRNYNQAIMDFGALCCTLTNPECSQCPLSSNCIAHQNGQVAEYPRRTRETSLRTVTIKCCVVFDQHFDCLLRLRGSSGTYSRMWDTPEVTDDSEPQALLRQMNLPTSNIYLFDNVHTKTYRISNQRVTEELTIAKYSVPSMELGTPSNTRWTPMRSLRSVGLPVRAMQRIQLAKTLVESK